MMWLPSFSLAVTISQLLPEEFDASFFEVLLKGIKPIARLLEPRGDLTLWLSPASIAGWNAKPSGRRGGQQKYLDLAIETALTLRLVYHLPLRQTEGFLSSLFAIMAVPLKAPDHTTLSRRSGTLNIPLVATRSGGPIDLVVDSTGLATFGQGQWAAAKHGGKGTQKPWPS